MGPQANPIFVVVCNPVHTFNLIEFYFCLFLFVAIKDISHHLEITRDSDDDAKPRVFPKSPDTVNFDLEVARKLIQPDDERLVLPEIVDATQKITKAKAKKRKGKSKIPQRQESKDDEQESAGFDVVWDFDDRKEENFLKDERLRQAGYDTTNGKGKGQSNSWMIFFFSLFLYLSIIFSLLNWFFF